MLFQDIWPLPLFRNSSLIVPCIFSLKTLALEALFSLEIYNDFPFFGVGNYVDMFWYLLELHNYQLYRINTIHTISVQNKHYSHYWEGPFDLGIFYMNHRFNSLSKTEMWGSGKVLWVLPRIPCRIFSPHLRTGLYAVGRILTRAHVLTQKGLRSAL